MAETVEEVALADWVDRVGRACRDGFDFPAAFTAVDEVGRTDHIRLLLILEDVTSGDRVRLETLVDRDGGRAPGISSLLPGAAWLQRQIHDFFGVEFEGEDNRPLLNHAGGAPLRKDFLLEPRLATRWPGALEPGESDSSPSRRKLVPPGVPEPGLLDDPAATAADIALSASGTRVRRTR